MDTLLAVCVSVLPVTLKFVLSRVDAEVLRSDIVDLNSVEKVLDDVVYEDSMEDILDLIPERVFRSLLDVFALEAYVLHSLEIASLLDELLDDEVLVPLMSEDKVLDNAAAAVVALELDDVPEEVFEDEVPEVPVSQDAAVKDESALDAILYIRYELLASDEMVDIRKTPSMRCRFLDGNRRLKSIHNSSYYIIERNAINYKYYIEIFFSAFLVFFAVKGFTYKGKKCMI